MGKRINGVGANPIELSTGWWVRQSRLYLTNSAVFTSDDRALLVDPGIYPDELQAIAEFTRLRSLQIQAVVLTHSHWDHILGPEVFPEPATIAHQAFNRTAAQGEATLRRDLADWEKEAGLPRHRSFRIPHPLITFDQRLSIEVGSQTIALIAAPGHAADQIVAYHPASQTLWAGDMLSDVEIPFIQHSLAAYRTTLDRMAGMELRCLIPGHGAPTRDPSEAAARLANDRSYLAELQERVSQALSRGYSLGETQALCQSIPFRQEREANREPHRRNVESAYLEAGGSDPAAEGWSQSG